LQRSNGKPLMPDVITLAIIPARGGSKGLPRKNIRPVAGKPLVAYSIDAARKSPLVSRVIVSTDDEEIAAVARLAGADVPFMRPPELATDLAPTEPVLQHALKHVEEVEGQHVDIVLFLQPTDIFRRGGIVNQCIQRLIDDPTLDTCFPGFPTHKNYWRRQGDAWVKLAADIQYGPRQKREHLFREETGIACASRAHVIRACRRIGDKVDIVPYKDEAVFIDVEDEFTFWLAERVVSEWGYHVNE
jgi:CMP-N,N'-diacetyllegionaminic acid synthase